MPKKNFLSDSKGSAPLELASLVALLLLPLAPMLIFYEAIFDAIAAESIARHALRAAILNSPEGQLDKAIDDTVAALARSWRKEALFRFDCGRCEKGDLIQLEIRVGDAVSVQVAGLEPK